MNYIAIGNQIRKYRRLRNLSQEQLAEKINISTTHMSHIETGSTKLSLPVLVRLAEILEVPTDDILFGEKGPCSSDELPDILKFCGTEELEIITEIIKTTKKSLEKYFIK